MAEKYSNISNTEKGQLLSEFCEALSVLKNSEEMMNFLIDLFTRQEIIMLAKRIKVAKLLIQGNQYREIEKMMKMSPVTVAKIAHWLDDSGEGFRIIAERSKGKKINQNKLIENPYSLKRRYPIMFWPEIVLEEIVSTMNKKQKQKLNNSIKKLDRKSKLHKQITKLIK